ncbi:MAG: hypothetical protein OQK55_05305 [Thermoanaerobaculales bacterium]|jgi:hypothetical protein|nr:hypothetical protein [Thermoanaerobaculales bacterium]
MKRKIIVFNSVLFVLLFGLISFNKEYLRPSMAHLPFAGVLVGSLPNFLAAFVISLASVYAVLTRGPKHGRLIVYAVSILVCAGLTVEELMPFWGASTYFDPFDILASGIGSFLAMLGYELAVRRRRKKQKEDS